MLQAVLFGILVIEWVVPRGKKGSLIESPPLVKTGIASVSPRVRKPAAWEEIVLQRPLFSSDRKPLMSISTLHNGNLLGVARLSGIFITRFIKRAIFEPVGGGKPSTLAEGSQVNGSTIIRIESERVFLSSGVVLKPSFKTNPVSSTQVLISLTQQSTETTKSNLVSTPLQRSLLGASQAPHQESGLNPNGSIYVQPGQSAPMSYHPSLLVHRTN